MLRVHTADGLTTSFDLGDERQAAEWIERLKDPRFQASIRGLTLSDQGALYSMSGPSGFRRVSFLGERVEAEPERRIKGGERLTCFADDVRICLMVHREQKAIRVSLSKIGNQRFNPALEG